MKMHPTKTQINADKVLHIVVENIEYAIPEKVARLYRVHCSIGTEQQTPAIPAEAVFSALDAKYSKPGALLKGLRAREGLTQLAFAEKLNISQPNLSAMERGHRAIGKNLAQKIGILFHVDYRYFL